MLLLAIHSRYSNQGIVSRETTNKQKPHIILGFLKIFLLKTRKS